MKHVIEKKFPIGVEVSPGIISNKFKLRAGKVRDSVEAIEECGTDASFIRVKFATLARRLTIDALDEVTTETVLDLHDADLFAIEEASVELDKMMDREEEPQTKQAL